MQRAVSAGVGWTGASRTRAESNNARMRFAAVSAGEAPCARGESNPFATPFVGSAKIAGELTTSACSGCASGILMTSMRKFELFGSQGLSLQRASSSDGRIPDVPEM
jgi:hypothetical protein